MLTRGRLASFAAAYRINRWLDCRLTPAGRWLTVGLVLSLVFAIDTRHTLAFQLASLLGLVLLAASLGNLSFRPRLRLVRELPAEASVARPCHYRLRLESERPLPRHLYLQDELVEVWPDATRFRHAGEAQSRRNWFDRVVGFPRWLELVSQGRGGECRTVSWSTARPVRAAEVALSITPLRRGHLQFVGVRLMRPDLFGLTLCPAVQVLPQRLLVLPRLYRVPPLAQSGRRRAHAGGTPRASSVGDAQEFHALREYRPGDPFRRMHFPSWARTGRPHVKEYQDEYYDRQAVVLDTFAGHAAAARFEEAVSIAASLAVGGGHPDQLIDLMFIGPRPMRLTAGRGTGDVRALLEALATAELTPDVGVEVLSRLVAAHADETSGMTVVFIVWDEARAALLRRIRVLGVTVRSLLVIDADAEAPAAGPDTPTPLRLGRVGPDLARALGGKP